MTHALRFFQPVQSCALRKEPSLMRWKHCSSTLSSCNPGLPKPAPLQTTALANFFDTLSPSSNPSVPNRRRPASQPHFTTRALVGPAADYYRDAEGLDDTEADMNVWNSVIHASLKRKLEGLVAENPVQNGVSALMHAAPGYTSSAPPSNSAQVPRMPPAEVVSHLLESFAEDALVGATTFIKVASEKNHVKRSSPQSLVLFVGDNDSYRILLRLKAFSVQKPRFEHSGEKCVVRADVNAEQDEIASFDFQLTCYDGQWLIDECFRL